MPLSKIVFTALTGSLTVTAALLGSWMAHVSEDQHQTSQRLTTMESHYAVIDQRLTDLQEQMRDLKRTWEKPHAH